MVKDQESENIGYSALRWDVPKFPYYTGGRAYRTPSSQGSTISMPRVSSSSQQLFHHNAGGTYAEQGTGTYRSSYAQSSGRPVHTFSQGGIYSYGGGGGSGGATGVTTNRKASNSVGSAGYSMPSMSISIPRAHSYAYNRYSSSSYSSSSAAPTRQMISGRRKAKPDDNGTEGEVVVDTEDPGKWWYWDDSEEDWFVVTEIGHPWIHDGETYYFNGTDWVVKENQADADSPIGDMPWMLLLLMAGGYVVLRRRDAIMQRKQIEAESIENRIL